jgi:ABC-2 type transport system ATP-binding protein
MILFMTSISLLNVTKKFGSKTAVDSIKLDIRDGALFGFLGQNGAGKTTTIRMIAGLLTADSGKIFIKGAEINVHDQKWKKQIGLLSDDLGFFYRLTLWEHLVFVGQLYGLSYADVTARAEELLNYLDAWDAKDTIAYEASNGTKKKLALALALIHNPQILLVDEPFEGIDFVTAKKIKELFLSLSARGKTVFITSHILEIVEQIIDSFAVISEGRIIHESTLSELKAANRSLPDIYSEIVSGKNSGISPELAWLE